MKHWKAPALVILTLGLVATELIAQAIPAIPAVPGAAAPATTAAPAAAGGLGKFCSALKACCENCKNKMCGSPLGALMGGMMAPMSALTGGILHGKCDTPSQAALADPGAEGTAAAIQAEEADAKKRRAAVRYLATVDCHYWPEAEKSLIGSLRADKNECVRWEAAMGLGSGCCCTKRVMQALTLTINESNKDGNPSETSPRVRDAALRSLTHCLKCYHEIVPEPERPEKPPEMPGAAKTAGGMPIAPNVGAVTFASAKNYLEGQSMEVVVAEARRVVAVASKPPTLETALTAFPTGKRSLFDVWQNANLPGCLLEAPKDAATVAPPVAPARLDPVALAVPPSAAPAALPSSTITMLPAAPPSTLPADLPATLLNNATPVPELPARSEAVAVPPTTPPLVPAMAPIDVKPDVAKPTVLVLQPAPVSVVPTAPPEQPQAVDKKPRVTIVGVHQPAAPPPGPTSAGPSVEQLLLVLSTSTQPAQREWAVQQLIHLDWCAHPEAATTLVTACLNDNSATVRASCIRCLSDKKLRTSQVLNALQFLKSDPDARIRQEAVQALSGLGGSPTFSAVFAPSLAVQAN